MRKLFLYSLITIFTILGFSSCLTKPDFPFQPSISFSSIKKISFIDDFGGPGDSVIIGIKFRDGNGDIGLTTSDTTGNFAPFLPDKSRNPFYYNYYCTIYRRNKFSGEYERFTMFLPPPNSNIEANIHGRVPPLLENARPSPIEGELFYEPPVISDLYNDSSIPDPTKLNKRDSIKFEVFIYDRALNKSNTIMTSAILVNP